MREKSQETNHKKQITRNKSQKTNYKSQKTNHKKKGKKKTKEKAKKYKKLPGFDFWFLLFFLIYLVPGSCYLEFYMFLIRLFKCIIGVHRFIE